MDARPGHGPPAPGVGDCPDDAALVAAAQADPRAFTPLYRRYVEPVYRYCARRLADPAEAEEATSQVFCQALAALPAYRAGSFRSWLFAIAHNVIADRWRRRRPTEPLATAGDPPDAAGTPEELVLAAEERRAVRALLDRLPPDQRRVVELRLAGLTGREIAAALGRSPAAIKMLQFRAVTRLRALLAARPEGGPHARDS